jgi:hypothetical protein
VPQTANLTEGELSLLRQTLSEPEALAVAEGEGGVASFRFDSEGDDRGMVYWLGTRGYLKGFVSPMSFGQINVQSSGMETGDENTLVSRVPRESRTKDEPGNTLKIHCSVSCS